jgi:hypothetical protein
MGINTGNAPQPKRAQFSARAQKKLYKKYKEKYEQQALLGEMIMHYLDTIGIEAEFDTRTLKRVHDVYFTASRAIREEV